MGKDGEMEVALRHLMLTLFTLLPLLTLLTLLTCRQWTPYQQCIQYQQCQQFIARCYLHLWWYFLQGSQNFETRSSKDEYSTGSNNHLRSTDLFRSKNLDDNDTSSPFFDLSSSLEVVWMFSEPFSSSFFVFLSFCLFVYLSFCFSVIFAFLPDLSEGRARWER